MGAILPSRRTPSQAESLSFAHDESHSRRRSTARLELSVWGGMSRRGGSATPRRGRSAPAAMRPRARAIGLCVHLARRGDLPMAQSRQACPSPATTSALWPRSSATTGALLSSPPTHEASANRSPSSLGLSLARAARTTISGTKRVLVACLSKVAAAIVARVRLVMRPDARPP